MAERIFRVRRVATIEGVRYDPSSPDPRLRFYRAPADVRETVIGSLVRNNFIEQHVGDDPFGEKAPPPEERSPARRPDAATGEKPKAKGGAKGKGAAKGGGLPQNRTVKTQSAASKVAQELDEEKTTVANTPAPDAPSEEPTDGEDPDVDQADDEGESDEGEGE